MKLAKPTMEDRLLRKREVAEILACSLRTVEREANTGHLTRIKLRGGVRFRYSEVCKIITGKRHDI